MQKFDSRQPDDAGDIDLVIEEKLASGILDEQLLGLMLLDETKREGFCGRLKNHNSSLTKTDLKQIWLATMESIYANVMDGRFKTTFERAQLVETEGARQEKSGRTHRNKPSKTGGTKRRKSTLNAYIDKIMRARGVDFLRRRIPIDPDFDLRMLEDEILGDEPHESHFEELRQLLWDRYPRLARTEKRVLGHYIQLFLAKEGNPPSTDDLTAACNADGGRSLTREAVKSACARAFSKLRGDGYGKGEPQ